MHIYSFFIPYLLFESNLKWLAIYILTAILLLHNIHLHKKKLVKKTIRKYVHDEELGCYKIALSFLI